MDEFNFLNYEKTLKAINEIQEFKVKQLSDNISVPKEYFNDNFANDTVEYSSRFTEWEGLMKEDMKHRMIDDFYLTLNYKPKRLPRKIKKAYKKGVKSVCDKINRKYPTYWFKNCKISVDLADGNDSFNEKVYKINYDGKEYI